MQNCQKRRQARTVRKQQRTTQRVCLKKNVSDFSRSDVKKILSCLTDNLTSSEQFYHRSETAVSAAPVAISLFHCKRKRFDLHACSNVDIL